MCTVGRRIDKCSTLSAYEADDTKIVYLGVSPAKVAKAPSKLWYMPSPRYTYGMFALVTVTNKCFALRPRAAHKNCA